MSDLKLGFVVNTKYAKEGNIAQQIHLLIVRILLHYCYTPKTNVSFNLKLDNIVRFLAFSYFFVVFTKSKARHKGSCQFVISLILLSGINFC